MENKNLPAFPIDRDNSVKHLPENQGLTKREYFAIEIAKGLCAGNRMNNAYIPDDAVRLADALLTSLNK